MRRIGVDAVTAPTATVKRRVVDALRCRRGGSRPLHHGNTSGVRNTQRILPVLRHDTTHTYIRRICVDAVTAPTATVTRSAVDDLRCRRGWTRPQHHGNKSCFRHTQRSVPTPHHHDTHAGMRRICVAAPTAVLCRVLGAPRPAVLCDVCKRVPQPHVLRTARKNWCTRTAPS